MMSIIIISAIWNALFSLFLSSFSRVERSLFSGTVLLSLFWYRWNEFTAASRILFLSFHRLLYSLITQMTLLLALYAHSFMYIIIFIFLFLFNNEHFLFKMLSVLILFKMYFQLVLTLALPRVLYLNLWNLFMVIIIVCIRQVCYIFIDFYKFFYSLLYFLSFIFLLLCFWQL